MTETVEPPVSGEPTLDTVIVAGGPGAWRDVALGAAFEAGDVAARWLAGLRRADELRRARMAELAERGARERVLRRRHTAEAVDAAVGAVAGSSIVNRVVDAQIERILRPVVLAVLDEVLAVLEQHPERVQGVLHGQRDSMVDELLTRIRTGAATGDTAVDRFTVRMLRRGGPAVPPSDP